MKEREYYIQIRKGQEILEEWIAEIEDGDNVILDREGYVILVIRYKDN